MKQSLSQKLQQKLTPQQILLMKLIQLPSTELDARLKKELEENPVIEDTNIESETPEDSDSESEDYEKDENELGEEDYYHQAEEEIPTTAKGPASEGQQFFSLSVTESLQDELLNQISVKTSTEAQHTIAKYLIGSLDDSGYLRRDLGSIVDDLAFTQYVECTEEEVNEVLHILQGLDPAGVGARDLQESLLLQLKRKDHGDLIVKNAIYILENLFDDFTHKRFEKIEEKTNISEADLREVLDEIKSLNPKPGEPQAEMNQNTTGIIPDFEIYLEEDEVNVALTNSSIPELNINRSYLNMIKDYEKSKDKTKKDTVKFIKSKVESARWFIDALRQREETLMKTMVAIAERQKEYFQTGDERHIQPMILKDIAEIIDMDISTVSRVVNSKFVQSPYGVFKLKKFFSESFVKESGEEVSTLQVKEILKEIIEAEDKSSPKKDDELMELLNNQGYPIARRTVAKYREQLGIPVARLRRIL